jgi:hypothetical protein
MLDPRDELRASRDYWRDDANFAPILPRSLAARLRPWLYGACIIVCIVLLGRVLHVESVSLRSWAAAGVAVVLLYGLGRLVRWVEDRPQVEDRQPATGETIRLVDEV